MNSSMTTRELGEAVERIDRRITQLAIWGGAAVAISLLWIFWQQRELTRVQSDFVKNQTGLVAEQRKAAEAQLALLEIEKKAALERQKVNFTYELTALPSDGENLFLSARITNHSASTVHVAMLGVRLWKSGWSDDDTVTTRPDLLLYSDSRVAECPAEICSQAAQAPSVKLAAMRYPVEIAPAEVHRETLGPYRLGKAALTSGFWIQGWAYSSENDEGRCAIAGPPPTKGGFPRFCNEKDRTDPECSKKAECIQTEQPGVFFSLAQQHP